MTPTERLRTLAKKLRELDAIPTAQRNYLIHMGWFQVAKGLNLVTEMGEEVVGDHKCGTAGCAIGYAPLIPELAADGIYADEFGGVFFGDSRGYWAAEDFFDLTGADAHHLFNPIRYDVVTERDITPTMVADRIDKHLETRS
jgi:hypothetical protein